MRLRGGSVYPIHDGARVRSETEQSDLHHLGYHPQRTAMIMASSPGGRARRLSERDP